MRRERDIASGAGLALCVRCFMNRPLHAGLTARPYSTVASLQDARHTVQSDHAHQDGHPQRSRPLMRKYEVSYLAPSGEELSVSRIAPATALFEAPFMGFARGTLIATPEGPVAVEDIYPGMPVSTGDHGPRTVLWRGSTTIVPNAAGQSEQSGRLTRIPADAMGLQRPSHDLLLGHGARVFRANRGHMVPAADLIDGETAIPVTPPSPVHVFHLLLERHSCIKACGVEVESFHPGATLGLLVQRELRGLYLSLFPHMSGLDGFGPVKIPRIDEEEAGAA